MEPAYCIDCGATIRVKPKTPGVCPYCGVHIATGRDTFRAVDEIGVPAPLREKRRRDTRGLGAAQFGVGAVLMAVFASKGWFLATFRAGMLAAHGPYRIVFASGPNKEDEDYEDD